MQKSWRSSSRQSSWQRSSTRIRVEQKRRRESLPERNKVFSVSELKVSGPLNVGDFSGKKKDAAAQEQMDWYVDNPSIKIPGGESLNDFKGRIRPCILEALMLADKAGAPVLEVADSSVMHEVSSMFCGHHNKALVKPGGVIEVYAEIAGFTPIQSSSPMPPRSIPNRTLCPKTSRPLTSGPRFLRVKFKHQRNNQWQDQM